MTALTRAEATTLLIRYGLRAHLVEPLPGGMENTHIKAWTGDGTVVVTVLGKKDHRQAQEYTRFLGHLIAVGVPLPALRRTLDGDTVTGYRDRPVIVCDYVAGTSPDPPASVTVRRIGTLLATAVHRPAPAGMGLLSPHLRLADTDAHTLDELPDTEFGRWARRTWQAVSHVPDQPGTTVPIHADLFPDNVIVTSDDDLVLIDWEDGSLDLPVIDLGMAILGLCCTPSFSPSRVWALLLGYQDGGASLPDLDLLRDAARYAAVLVALRRYRWQQKRNLPADPTRTAEACRQAEALLIRGWTQLSRQLSVRSGIPAPDLLHHRKD